jgi:hydroxyacylglutathione hydrolase
MKDLMLTGKEAYELQQQNGALLVDFRSPGDFAGGHARGALSIPFDKKNVPAMIMRTGVTTNTPLILITNSDNETTSAYQQLNDAGMPVAGVLEHGIISWEQDELPLSTLDEIHVEDLHQKIKEGSNLVVLDVRESIEWETGHVPGATLISLGDLHARWQELPSDTPVVVICEAGIRSATAASLLKINGLANIANVPEGSAGYRQGSYNLEFYSSE